MSSKEEQRDQGQRSVRIARFGHIDVTRKLAFRCATSNRNAADSLLALASVARYGLQKKVLALPIEATFPDPPDIVLDSCGTVIAVEVTQVTWKRKKQITSQAKPGDVVELDRPLLTDRKIRKGSNISRFIKRSGEALEGDGMLGAEPLILMNKALLKSIRKKTQKIERYLRAANTVWLFLIDETYPADWGETGFRKSDQAALDELRQEVNLSLEQSGFDHVFRLSNHQDLELIYKA